MLGDSLARVPVITGIDLISGLGVGKQVNWRSMVAGKSGIRRISRFEPSRLMTKIGGELPPDFEEAVAKNIRKFTLNRTSQFTHLALLCSLMALRDSGLDLDREDHERIGVILGNSIGGVEYLEREFREVAKKHVGATITLDNSFFSGVGYSMENLFAVKFMQNALSAQVAIEHKLFGPNMVISTACAAGGMAVEIAADYIRWGVGDIFIAGGVEIFVTESGVMSFNKLTALSLQNAHPEKAIKPFDKNRDGTVLGDGAGIMIIESEEHARNRGATIYARILGHANVCEGYSLATPEPSGKGMALVMKKALLDARINPDQVDYLSAHGTGTFHNDRAESKAIHAVFGGHAKQIPVSSQKSMIGHTIGAAGGIELAVTALSLQTGILTPNINYETPDPHCDLNIVKNEAWERPIAIAVSNSFALGGHNSCIVLQKVE